MPCESVRTTTVNLDNIDARELLLALTGSGHVEAALGQWERVPQEQALAGGGGRFRIRNGKLELSGPTDTRPMTSYVKRAYTAHTVAKQAARYGWKVTRTGQNTLELQR